MNPRFMITVESEEGVFETENTFWTDTQRNYEALLTYLEKSVPKNLQITAFDHSGPPIYIRNQDN